MYKISDDSIFLSEFLEKYLSHLSRKKLYNLKYLDMGCGSGILSEKALKCMVNAKNITAADIDDKSVRYVKSKFPNIRTVKSNLFSNLKNQKFDLITFNPPYLPEDKKEPKSSKKETTGGKRGDEISLKFLKQAKNHLKEKAKILLLISSLTYQKRIKRTSPKILTRKKLFFEELFILGFE
jgi:HemK-related putative methylase